MPASHSTREYCEAAGCTQRAIALRSSADGYAARRDLGTDLDCDAEEPLLSIEPGSGDVHVFWTLASHGTCTATCRNANARYG